MRHDIANVDAWPGSLANFASKAVVMTDDYGLGRPLEILPPAWLQFANGWPLAVQVGRPRQLAMRSHDQRA